MSDTLASALVAALTDLSVIEKGRKANVGSYSYEYADIADVVKLTRPKLAEHGIVALTPVHDHGNGLACTVTLVHTSGETMDLGPFPFPAGRDAQATGSAVTYHRRYALVSALGLAAGDDDDGAAATKSARQPEPQPEAEPAVGLSSAEAFAKLTSYLNEQGIEDAEDEHGKSIWKTTHPKASQDGLIYESEIERLLDGAASYVTSVREHA